MTGREIEIERKWLLARAPAAGELAALGARPFEIEQVYLTPTAGAPVRRIRRSRGADGRAICRYTEKAPIAGLVRAEREREIAPDEYERLLAEADPALVPIRKTRHVFEYAGRTLELDVFAAPPELVLLEVEIDDPAEMPDLPPALAVVREVSDDPAYFNVNLARARGPG